MGLLTPPSNLPSPFPPRRYAGPFLIRWLLCSSQLSPSCGFSTLSCGTGLSVTTGFQLVGANVFACLYCQGALPAVCNLAEGVGERGCCLIHHADPLCFHPCKSMCHHPQDKYLLDVYKRTFGAILCHLDTRRTVLEGTFAVGCTWRI